MQDVFLDCSAIVKLYVRETGTTWLRVQAGPDLGRALFVATITHVEVVAAIARKARIGGADSATASAAIEAFRRDLPYRYESIALSPGVLELATDLAARRQLRAYDAVQPATAALVGRGLREVGRQLIVPSADHELNTAATAEGLTVDDPNGH